MKLKAFIESRFFTRSIMALILVNAILIGFETVPEIYEPNKGLFTILDRIFLSLFTLEIIAKVIVYKAKYFKNGWDLLDFSIVALSIIFYTTNLVAVLRLIRVLRVLRTITAVRSLRRLVSALLMSIPAMGSTLLLMMIIFYIYAIIGTTFFAEASDYFSSLPLSLISLFQVFTLESWASGIFWPIFKEVPLSWIYFISFILMTAFIIANLFFGELVNNAQRLSKTLEEEEDDTSIRIKSLQNEVENLKSQNEDLAKKLDVIVHLLNKK